MKYLIDALKDIVKQDFRSCSNWRRSSKSSSLTFEALQPRQLLAAVAINSGDWSDETVWQDGILPSADERVIISNGVTVELDSPHHFMKELVIQGELSVPEGTGANANKSLTTRWIHVNSGGLFRVGSETDRFDQGTFTVNLTGTDTEAEHTIEGVMMSVKKNDGFLMTASQGRVEFYGEDKLSFTKLAASVGENATEITVHNVIERNFSADGDAVVTSAADDGELNWEVGDQIVIASSSYDYTEEEVRLISAINDNGDGTTTITLDSALEHSHYGVVEEYGDPASPIEIDLRAEVALLSRNVTIRGDLSQDTDESFGDRQNLETENRVRPSGLSDAEWEELPGQQVANGIGGHLMFMRSSGPIKIEGVQLDGLGQASQKGRYPIHWHLGDSRPNDVFRNSSVTNSNNRGVTIHGTSDLTIEGIVLHDIHGHGFFFEDAVETGNRLVGNLAIGIHTVGGNDKNFAAPGKKDPFIVDSHDSVLETNARFSSSAAYWITNPNNIFVGNIAAGAGDQRTDDWAEPEKGVAAGTGFWYAIPRVALGISGTKGLYENVNPIFAEFGQFDFNTSHTTAVGLNFDRGSDIEDASFNADPDLSVQTANEYSPREGGVQSGGKLKDELASVVKGFTNYKASDAAVYHRGEAESIQFDGLRIADSLNGPWAVSENTYTNSLFIGHSKGNADVSQSVGGPRLYDGAGLYSNTHFAGFSESNAFAFQVEGSSFGPTMYHAFQGTSFEDDETLDNVAHAVSDFQQEPSEGHDLSRPFKWIKGVIDLDGTLTSSVGGGVGYGIVPNIDFLIEDNDVQPDGWDAVLTNDVYARIRVENFNDGSDQGLFPSDSNGRTVIRFTARDGDFVDVVNGQNGGDHSWVQIAAKTDGDGDVEGTFTIEFGQDGVPEDGFVLNMKNQDGGRPELVESIQQRVDAARIVVKIVAAESYTPTNGTEVTSEAELRSATDGVVYFRDGLGNLLLNTGIRNDQPLIELTPGVSLQEPFAAHTVSYGTTIEAEHFDSGFNSSGSEVDGIAYHDSDEGNSLGSFRSETGVDATDSIVGDIVDGEWLEYTANVVPSAYDIGFRVSSNQAGGQIRVLAARSNSSGFVTQRSLPGSEPIIGDFGLVDVPDTGGEFETVWLKGANLFPVATEDSVIRLEFVGGGFEIDSMEFAAPDQQPFVPGRTIEADLVTTFVELEEFDNGGQGVAYFDDTPGNDENKVGEEENHFRDDEDVDVNGSQLNGKVFEGEWLEYTTNIEPGLYDITLQKKWGGEDSGVKLFIADSNAATESDFVQLHQFDFTNGDAENLTVEDVDLSAWAGTNRVLRIEIVGNWMGLDRLEFVSKTQVAPQVESFEINDGQNQRSIVSSLKVNFNEVVPGLDSSSFSLVNTDSNAEVVPSVTSEIVNGRTVATLTFSGEETESGSLVDGNYELTLLASAITDAAGNQLDGDGDGMGGDNAVDAFFRLFGDADGSRTVNVFDLLALRKVYGESDVTFDANSDGAVNVFDLLQFRKRYQSSI